MLVLIRMTRLDELRAMLTERRASLPVNEIAEGEMLTDAIDEIAANVNDVSIAHDIEAAKLAAWRLTAPGLAS